MSAMYKGPLLLALAMLAFAAMGAFAKIAGTSVPFTELVLFRSAISAALILVWVRQQRIPVNGNRSGLLFARAVSGTIALIMFFYAITKMSVATAMVLNQTAPVFVLPLAALFLRERITLRHVVFVGTALFGVTLVVKPTFAVDALPALLALGSALFAAVAYVLVRVLTKTEQSAVIVLWFNAVSAMVTLPAALPHFVVPTPEVWLVLIGMALMATLGQILMTVAYRHAEAGRLAVVGSLGAVFAAGFDLAIWHHLPDIGTAIGGVIIIASCALLQAKKTPPRRRSSPPAPLPRGEG